MRDSNRCNPPGHILHRVEIDIPDRLAVRAAIHSHVDHARAGFDHAGGHQIRAAKGPKPKIGPARRFARLAWVKMIAAMSGDT